MLPRHCRSRGWYKAAPPTHALTMLSSKTLRSPGTGASSALPEVPHMDTPSGEGIDDPVPSPERCTVELALVSCSSPCAPISGRSACMRGVAGVTNGAWGSMSLFPQSTSSRLQAWPVGEVARWLAVGELTLQLVIDPRRRARTDSTIA